MAKSKFRLEPLLRLREATRDDRRADLAQAYEAERILGEQKENISSDIHDLKENSRQAARPGSINVDVLLAAHRHELALRAHEQLLDQQGSELTAEIERRHESLVEADQEVRILEKLKEKKLAQQKHDEALQQVKRMDEVASRRSLRDDEL